MTIAAALTLQVMWRVTTIGEVGGKEWKEDSQGMNARALHFIRRTPKGVSIMYSTFYYA